MPSNTTKTHGKSLPNVWSGGFVPNPNRFLGFLLLAIVAMTDNKLVHASAEKEHLWCPNDALDSWDAEECQENLYFVSKGADEDHYELEDVTADPKFAKVIEQIRYPLMPYGIPMDRLLDPNLQPDDVVHENILYATIGDQMARYSADSFLIYQNGQLIYEKYAKAGDIAFPDPDTGGENKIRANDFSQNDRHALFSVTKSFIGMVFAKLLVEVDDFNQDDLVIEWVPELAETSAFNTATVRMVADMSVDFEYDETGSEKCSSGMFGWSEEIEEYVESEKEGIFPLPKGCEQFAWKYLSGLERPAFPEERFYNGTLTGKEFLDSLPSRIDFVKQMKRDPATEHGIKFEYRSVLSEVVALICAGVIEKVYPEKYASVADYFEKEIWAKLGTDEDMSLTADADGVPYWWSMGSTTARDLLRSGILLLNNGTNHKGEEILPKEAVDDIFDGTDLSRSQILSGAISGSSYAGVLLMSDVIYNSTLFPDRKECEVMTPDWSYHGQFRSYNPGKKKGTGEIVTFEGYRGQNVYIDRKANLVAVQLSSDRNYPLPIIQEAFYALSSYFRCNPPIGTMDMDATNDLPEEDDVEDEDVKENGDETNTEEGSITVSSSAADGGYLSICKYSGAFLSFIGFFFI